jgi:hypothetical protein
MLFRLGLRVVLRRYNLDMLSGKDLLRTKVHMLRVWLLR